MSITLHAERITLVPVVHEDTEAILDLLHLPEVRRYLCDDTLVSPNFVEEAVADSLDRGSLTSYWRIEAEGDELIGLIGLRPQMLDALRLRGIGWRSLELIVALDPIYWGRGLASDAIEAVADYAGKDGVTFALVAGVDEPNERSHRLMRRSRFHPLGHIAGPAHMNVVYERMV